MARPKIVKETKRPVEERPPPPAPTLRAHQWLSKESLREFAKAIASTAPFDVYLSSAATDKMMAHAEKEAPKRLEVMGFMLGEVSVWEGKTYCVVKDAVTTGLRSSSSKVRFDPEAFPALFHGLDESGFDYVLVGWYHSHPGHTCFLSNTDMDTQKGMFDQPYHVALVIDPVNREIKTFKLCEGGYEEVPFAVFGQGPDAPNGRQRRSRRLKVVPSTVQK